MFGSEVEDDAMGGIAKKRLAGLHGSQYPALAFDAQVALESDGTGVQTHHCFGGMRVEVVHDQVRWRVRGTPRQQAGQELRKILLSACLAELRRNLPGRYVEPGDQGVGTVANVLELAALDVPRGHRPGRSYPLKRLNPSHFVNRDRRDSRRRPNGCQAVGLADVVALLGEPHVCLGVEPAARAMRLEVHFFLKSAPRSATKCLRQSRV